MDTVTVSTTGLATCLAERDALRARVAELVAALRDIAHTSDDVMTREKARAALSKVAL